MTYKGDVDSRAAYERLKQTQDACLIDVRTRPEWAFVGLPDVENLIRLEWQQFPTMEVNEAFVEAVEQTDVAKDAEIFLLCRSGARSAAAASALTAAGFTNCYNIVNGFEGDLDEYGHRGKRNGWKAEGLPWLQK